MAARKTEDLHEALTEAMREEVNDLYDYLLKSQNVTKITNSVYSCSYGQFDAAWLGFYTYFAEVCDLDAAKPVLPLTDLASTCSWWWAFDEAVIMTEHPVHIKQDDQNRLHCPNGAAVLFSDGFGVYSWNGVRIPGQWTAGDLPSPEEALRWENMEQRRAACEMIGMHVILDKLGARVIDKDEDPMVGTLVEVDLPDSGKDRFLRVKCGTGRDFAICVPSHVKTALEANAWTYGIDPKEFKPEVRT